MNNILNFPDTTIVNKSVPKNAFWQRAEGRTELKDFLTREFESITWLYKLATSTLNVADGESVHEIDVFYCKMKSAIKREQSSSLGLPSGSRLGKAKSDSYSINPFCAMDKLLPRHTLFIIEYGESIDLLMQYKELVNGKWRTGETERLGLSVGSGQWTVGSSGHQPLTTAHCPLKIEGQTMDAVYASLLSQVSGLKAHDEDEYKQQAELSKQIANLEKQIATLQNNIRKEKQFNKQVEMNGEARALKKQLAELRKQIQ